ncbi:MAG: hypothetical protein ACFCUI_06745 [Bernardetiaceae bacterium]
MAISYVEQLVQRALAVKYPPERLLERSPYQPLFRFMERTASVSFPPPVRVLSQDTSEEENFWICAYQRGKARKAWVFVDKNTQKMYFLPKDTTPAVWRFDFEAFLQKKDTELDWHKQEFYLVEVRAKELPLLTLIGRQFQLPRQTRFHDLEANIQLLIDELGRLDVRPVGNPLLVQRWAGAMEVRWVIYFAIEEIFEPTPPYFLQHWPRQRVAVTAYEGDHFYYEALQQTKHWIRKEGLTTNDFIARSYTDWRTLSAQRRIQLWVGV